MSNNRLQRIETIVGRGSHVTGDMIVQGSIHINGEVDGSVRATGFVTVSETGVIHGGLTGEYAIVGGVVEGDVTVQGKVVLSKYAKLKGDIVSSRLIIEDGAVFEGKSTMSATKPTREDTSDLLSASNG
ncbi:MAG: polymer-forming cytoskeletal protein [Lentisphaeria bacterium]|nr:polymer-forming cytoskeletal protein [Candidatus Neomarinimicrobiota bacterium]MCF7842440.1 polymer-forming cytoskeletal protein [Lentisphaeria bacterium]